MPVIDLSFLEPNIWQLCYLWNFQIRGGERKRKSFYKYTLHKRGMYWLLSHHNAEKPAWDGTIIVELVTWYHQLHLHTWHTITLPIFVRAKIWFIFDQSNEINLYDDSFKYLVFREIWNFMYWIFYTNYTVPYKKHNYVFWLTIFCKSISFYFNFSTYFR